jgi:hypothetical protein
MAARDAAIRNAMPTTRVAAATTINHKIKTKHEETDFYNNGSGYAGDGVCAKKHC